jgi:hypothetical protein
MRVKKAVSIIIAFVVLAGIPAGCSQRSPGAAPGPSEPPASSPAPAPSPSPSPEPDPEEPAREEARLAELAEKREAAIKEADALAAQYFYDEALEALSDPEIADETVSAKIKEIEAAKASLVNYEGDIKHIFFHSLILYPEVVFRDKKTPMGGYNAGFSTKAEFEKMLPQLYERGYVLYDLNECYEKVDGVMTRKEILLPPGKQPLILSVDDVAYAYGSGFALNLTAKDDGSLVNLVKTPGGEIVEMEDGDVFGVLEKFVREHPDFSYKGHKGTLALTGFQGAFGFSLETEDGQAEIMKTAAALRARGWNFASHSYTHNRNNYFGPNSKPANIQYDTNKWMAKVAPYIGQTRLFIAPFGYRVRQPGLQYILDAGFEIYCTVSNKIVNELYDDYALMSRVEMSGYSMTYYKKLLNEHFFNVDEVFDAAVRPPVI